MKYLFFLIALITVCLPLKSFSQNHKDVNQEYRMDKEFKIYSNFKHGIAYKVPNNWEYDFGSAQNTIFRAFNKDSLLTFSINVVLTKTSSESQKYSDDIWLLYDINPGYFENIKDQTEKQVNSYLEDFITEKVYVRNKKAIIMSWRYISKELNFEYMNTTVITQIFKSNKVITLGLHVPTVLFEADKSHYLNLINSVSFLN